MGDSTWTDSKLENLKRTKKILKHLELKPISDYEKKDFEDFMMRLITECFPTPYPMTYVDEIY